MYEKRFALSERKPPLTIQANLAFLGWFFFHFAVATLKVLVQFWNKKNLDHFSSLFFKPKMVISRVKFLVSNMAVKVNIAKISWRVDDDGK